MRAGRHMLRTKFPTSRLCVVGQIRRKHTLVPLAHFRAYDFHRAPSTKPTRRGGGQSCHRLILDGLVNGTLHIAGDLPADSFPATSRGPVGPALHGEIFDALLPRFSACSVALSASRPILVTVFFRDDSRWSDRHLIEVSLSPVAVYRRLLILGHSTLGSSASLFKCTDSVDCDAGIGLQIRSRSHRVGMSPRPSAHTRITQVEYLGRRSAWGNGGHRPALVTAPRRTAHAPALSARIPASPLKRVLGAFAPSCARPCCLRRSPFKLDALRAY